MTVPSYTNWFDEYGMLVEAALEEAFEKAAVEARPRIPPTMAHRAAVLFAKMHAGELLKPDGATSLAAFTQERVQALVADTIDQGQSLRHLRRRLTEDVAFSRNRANLVARTETAIAHGRGSREAAREQGRDMKRWVTQGVACKICIGNEGDGDIGIDESFSDGSDDIPAHPNCECNVRYFHGPVGKSAKETAEMAKGEDTHPFDYKVLSKATEKRYTFGILYKATDEQLEDPEFDAHGEAVTGDVLQEAQWEYVRSDDRNIYLQHGLVTGGMKVIGEWVDIVSWPFEVTIKMKLPGGRTKTHVIPANSVFMGVVWNDLGWRLVKTGKLRGYSMGGWARRKKLPA